MPADIKWGNAMKVYKNKMTNTAYADLAVYCNQNALVIEDKGDYLEAVNPPEPTDEQKAAEARAERDRLLDAIRWRIERYERQTAAGIDTTDTAETYHAILLYCQYLRDIPQGAGEWWTALILSFDEWTAAKNV